MKSQGYFSKEMFSINDGSHLLRRVRVRVRRAQQQRCAQ
jgi:hypothetical protein